MALKQVFDEHAAILTLCVNFIEAMGTQHLVNPLKEI